MVTYELVDKDGGNVLGSYSSEEAALEDVRASLDDPSSASRIQDLALYGGDGLIAEGAALATRATRRLPSSRSA